MDFYLTFYNFFLPHNPLHTQRSVGLPSKSDQIRKNDESMFIQAIETANVYFNFSFVF